MKTEMKTEQEMLDYIEAELGGLCQAAELRLDVMLRGFTSRQVVEKVERIKQKLNEPPTEEELDELAKYL